MSDGARQSDPLDVAARLRALDSLPVDGHVAIYDALHRELRDQLAGGSDGLDSGDRADGAPEGAIHAGGAPRPGS